MPLLFNMFFTPVLRNAEKRFTADAVIVDSMVQLQRSEEEKRGKTPAGKVDEAGRRKPTRCGGCCTPTMQTLCHDHREGWRG